MWGDSGAEIGFIMVYQEFEQGFVHKISQNEVLAMMTASGRLAIEKRRSETTKDPQVNRLPT